MERTKKLQNYFKDFLPLNYKEFRRSVPEMTSNQSVVAELLRICCEDDDVKAMKMAFERILGKPEKVLVIKRTVVKTIFPDARTKHITDQTVARMEDETQKVDDDDEPIIIEAADAPGFLLRKQLDIIGDAGQQKAYAITDRKNDFTVAEVFAANVYATAMRGGNLGAIDLLFNYLDGAVADVVRIEGVDTLVLENYADVAPYEATQGEDGVWYIESEAVG
jgi:hypothetical protein